MLLGRMMRKLIRWPTLQVQLFSHQAVNHLRMFHQLGPMMMQSSHLLRDHNQMEEMGQISRGLLGSGAHLQVRSRQSPLLSRKNLCPVAQLRRQTVVVIHLSSHNHGMTTPHHWKLSPGVFLLLQEVQPSLVS